MACINTVLRKRLGYSLLYLPQKNETFEKLPPALFKEFIENELQWTELKTPEMKDAFLFELCDKHKPEEDSPLWVELETWVGSEIVTFLKEPNPATRLSEVEASEDNKDLMEAIKALGITKES